MTNIDDKLDDQQWPTCDIVGHCGTNAAKRCNNNGEEETLVYIAFTVVVVNVFFQQSLAGLMASAAQQWSAMNRNVQKYQLDGQ